MKRPVFISALSGRFFLIQLIIAFLCGVFAHFGFAPYNQQALVPIALLGLFALLNWKHYSFSKETERQVRSPKQQFQLGLSFGFGLFISGLRWVHVSLDSYGGLPLIVTLLMMVILALYLALFPALACYVFAKFKYKKPLVNVLLFTSAWVITEYLRGIVLTGFPWLLLGYSQTEGLFNEVASVFGVMGLTAIICLIATLSYYAVTQHRISMLLLAIVFIGGQFISSESQLTIQKESVDLALVQGNIEQKAKWDGDAMWPTITRYMDITRKHFDSDVIIWPEAAMPAVEGWVADYLRLMDSAASFNDSAIITGIIGRTIKSHDGQNNRLSSVSAKSHHYYNAMMTLGNATNEHNLNGIYQPNHNNRYYKHQLLPIGEFVPFESVLRPLAPLFNLPMSSFQRGKWAQPNLTARGFKFAPAICYEIAFSQLVRANMKSDTNFLLTISNDAWFGESIGPHQHMQIAQMRAIELGRPLIRVTNTGLTAIVDTTGKIVEQLPQFEEAVLRANVNVVSGETYFYRHGQTPIIIFFFSFLIITSLVNYRHKRTDEKIDELYR